MEVNMAIDMKKLEEVRQAIMGVKVRHSIPTDATMQTLAGAIAYALCDTAEERKLVTGCLLSPGPIQDDEDASRPYHVVWMFNAAGTGVGYYGGPFVRWAANPADVAREVLRSFGPAVQREGVVHVFDRMPVLTVNGIDDLPKKA